MKRIKTLTSYAAHFRFNSECDQEITFWLARKHCPVKTPYRSGATVAVVLWNGLYVWVADTAHKRYEVWQIPSELLKPTEAEAEREQFA